MPYSSKRELPTAAKALPSHAQDIFRKAFNAAYDQYNDEEKAFAVAWAAVKAKYKKEGGKWVAKDSLSFTDTFVVDQIQAGPNGYVRCTPRVARTGIQIYKGYEVGRPAMDEVRVYRPEAEVFAHSALQTLAGKPVTIEHPDVPVTPENWRDYAVGHLGDEVLRDGEFIRVPLHLMDAKAIKEVRDGRAQLSVGYTANLEWADGVAPNGEKYDVKQTSIRANHVAITHAARGGPKLRMGDGQKEKPMATRTITVGGIPVELEDQAAHIVEKQLKELDTALATARTELATIQTKATNDAAQLATTITQAQTKDAEIATLKQQLTDAKITPQKLQQMVQQRSAIVSRAASIIGDSVPLNDKTDEEIRRQVVNAKLGDVAKDWTDDMVTASFNTLTVQPTNNTMHQVVDVLRTGTPIQDARVAAYNEYEKALSERWKTAGQQV